MVASIKNARPLEFFRDEDASAKRNADIHF
ncbi:hypothetical protein [Butyrivibrio fibrisolvens]